MKQNNKNKKQPKHSLLPLKDNPEYLNEMNEYGLSQLIPRLVRELITQKIDLGTYGPYLLDPRIFPRITNIIYYLYQVNYMQYNSNIQYAQYIKANGLENTIDMNMLASITANNGANATVYAHVYEALFQYYNTGSYMGLLATATQDNSMSNVIAGIDTTGQQYYQRIENNNRRRNNYSDNRNNNQGRRYNDKRRNFNSGESV